MSKDNQELHAKATKGCTQIGREPRPRSCLPRIAHTVLLLMGLVALFAIGTSMYNYTNYIHSTGAVRDLHLEIASLQMIDDSNPRADIHFKLHNYSPLEIKIKDYLFDLYLNGERVGTSRSTYIGTDPNTDPGIYTKAANINSVLNADQYFDLKFTLYIYSAQMEIVRRAQRSDSLSWSVNASFRVLLPYASEWDQVRLSAEFEE